MLRQTNPYHFLDFLGIRLSFEDYFKDPANETAYLAGNEFLPFVRGGCGGMQCRGKEWGLGAAVGSVCVIVCVFIVVDRLCFVTIVLDEVLLVSGLDVLPPCIGSV